MTWTLAHVVSRTGEATDNAANATLASRTVDAQDTAAKALLVETMYTRRVSLKLIMGWRPVPGQPATGPTWVCQT